MVKRSLLFGLAEEMGDELSHSRGQPLRASLQLDPGTGLRERPEFREPHRCGEILVAAVLNAYLDVRTGRLERLAGDGDYLSREWVAEEAAAAAGHLLTLVVRALDYTPPVHLEFEDYLSALLAADYEVRPDDGRYQLQRHLKEAFARFGIEPAAEDSPDGRWRPAEDLDINYEQIRFESLQRDPEEAFRFVWQNQTPLGLNDVAHTRVLSVRPSFRTAPDDGFAVRETVVECLQLVRLFGSELQQIGLSRPDGMSKDDEITLRGGVTLIFNERGGLKYAVTKRFNPGAGENRTRQQERLNHLVERQWLSQSSPSASHFAAIHRLRARRSDTAVAPAGADAAQAERW